MAPAWVATPSLPFSDALPISRVDDFAYTILAQKLSTVPGVSESRIFGQRPYAVHVQINPGALAARGIGLEDVRAALTATTLDRPKGTLEGAHQTYTLDANDQLFNGWKKEWTLVFRSLARHRTWERFLGEGNTRQFCEADTKKVK